MVDAMPIRAPTEMRMLGAMIMMRAPPPDPAHSTTASLSSLACGSFPSGATASLKSTFPACPASAASACKATIVRPDMTRLMAAVAHSLEQLHIDFDYATLCSRGSTTGLSFRKLKLLHLELVCPCDSRVDLALFPALEHMVLAGQVNVYWEVESGFLSNLRFLQLGSVSLPKDPGDREHELMQLTALTTLIVDNADYRDFLAALSCFSSLRTLRLSNITRGCSEPYLSCPPLLSTLQICFSDLPRLPPSLAQFSRSLASTCCTGAACTLSRPSSRPSRRCAT
ncbi:unnamed protein product [Closterium sp. Yama58-4]|nr:unnamed protein product [Closterium sp. Yama58-4]